MKPHQSFHSFLSSLAKHSLLFENKAFCIAVLRMLDSTTAVFVFELLHTSLHIANIKTLTNIKETIQTLLALNLITKAENNITLNPVFRKTLLHAFSGDENTHQFNYNRRFKQTKSFSSTEKPLNEISERKFRSILELIASNAVNDLFGIKDVLYYCELVDAEGEITNRGFEFLLKPKRDQMWFLVVNAISFYSANTEEAVEHLLDFSEIAIKKDIGTYEATRWVPFYSFLDSLGLILIVRREHGKTIEFLVDNADLFGVRRDGNSKRFISLETNLKVYAYTSQSYEKSILSLFSKPQCTFPNLVKAQLDELSVVTAFNKGITTKQILRYLHEYCEDVPKNVENQIHIWEQKQHRIRTRNGYLYHDFIHLSDYNSVVRFLDARNALLFRDDQKRLVIGEERTHEETRVFIKKLESK